MRGRRSRVRRQEMGLCRISACGHLLPSQRQGVFWGLPETSPWVFVSFLRKSYNGVTPPLPMSEICRVPSAEHPTSSFGQAITNVWPAYLGGLCPRWPSTQGRLLPVGSYLSPARKLVVFPVISFRQWIQEKFLIYSRAVLFLAMWVRTTFCRLHSIHEDSLTSTGQGPPTEWHSCRGTYLPISNTSSLKCHQNIFVGNRPR